MDQLVLLSGLGREERMTGTVAELVDDEEGVQAFIRPSESVVAWNMTGSLDCVEDKRVSVQGRLAAGLPVKVLSTWQVIGSRDILVATGLESEKDVEAFSGVGDGCDDGALR
jgi:hypothetical protein